MAGRDEGDGQRGSATRRGDQAAQLHALHGRRRRGHRCRVGGEHEERKEQEHGDKVEEPLEDDRRKGGGPRQPSRRASR